MNETKMTVRTVLSFVLVLVLIVGTVFGINLPFGADDVLPEDTEKVEVEKEVPVEDAVVDDGSQDSAPTDIETDVADNSGETNVTEPTEDDKTVTEGDVENA